MKEKTTTAIRAALALIIITVCFSFDSSTLDEDTKRSLDEIIVRLDSLQHYTITLSGHTDNTGTDAYNDKLSESRAIAVKDYLLAKNVDSSKITIVFHGEKEPVLPNTSDENRAMNRRVEITVSGEKNPEVITIPEPASAEPVQVSVKTPKPKEVKTAAVQSEIRRKRVHRRLVWTGWKTGFHWSTSGR